MAGRGGPFLPFKPRWTIDKASNDYMKMRQDENLARYVPAEEWFAKKLKATGRKWGRQRRWGFRIFDFWNHELGVAIEIDGTTHNPSWDKVRDDYNYERSAIIVYRVPNYDEERAEQVINLLSSHSTWNERRIERNLKPVQERGQSVKSGRAIPKASRHTA